MSTAYDLAHASPAQQGAAQKALDKLGFTVPFIEHLGIEFLSYGEGASHLRIAPLPEHMNAYGMAHGGVVMTLLDVTMAFAALEPDRPGLGAITVEMKSTFLRPSTGVLTARGRLIHRTRTLVFLEATVFNGDGQPSAQASGTFVLKERPATEPSPNAGGADHASNPSATSG
ncbi:phenylacetic acid degradation protein [Vandammella animalimorsus]|uniref:Phenylacetic acid degradation protein n=1 Tax=Vandammella animalimorsus TaxID=2029117 RepID=A0A2A2T4H6_9BURK|nr:PaaI family thioesterase [Vandammella animalimorsus]PAX16403.1 phenylacetic acid degradation protein [Vandammella animalimorsus]PAX18818.1 phenylacetic acid degradation protein [Vandammella animalimorsus]